MPFVELPGESDAIALLVEPSSKGDPMINLRWTSKSLSKLSNALTSIGHKVSPMSVHNLLNELDYSLQGNRKGVEGKQNKDRDSGLLHFSRAPMRPWPGHLS